MFHDNVMFVQATFQELKDQPRFKTFFLVAASQAPALIDRLLIVKFLNALYIFFFECIIYKWQLNQIISTSGS